MSTIPHYYHRYDANCYTVAWLVDGFFHTAKGIDYLNDIIAGIKRLPEYLDRIAHQVVETVERLRPKRVDKALEEIRAMFGKTETRGKGLFEIVQEFKEREQPSRSRGLSR